MKLLFALTFIGVSSFSLLHAQEISEPIKPIKKFKITDVFLTTGLLTEKANNGILSDFQNLAPNSILLTNDFTGFSASNQSTINSSSMFSFNLGIRFADKEKTKYNFNPLLRIGVAYLSPSSLGTYYYKSDTFRGDTLTSSSSGQVLYVDTINTKTYWMNYSSDQLRLDMSILFYTKENARWTLFAGMGFTAGMSINSKTYLSYSEFNRTNLYNPSTNVTINQNEGLTNYSGNMEIINSRNNINGSVFLPMGVDFRIGKNSQFWKQIHLYYDLRPGLNITSIPELGTYANISIQHGLGFRYSW